MPAIPFLSLKDTNSRYSREINEAIKRVLESGIYLNGPEAERFSEMMSAIHRVDHSIGVSNGLDALRLIFRGYIEQGLLKEGDEVIAPANTYIASILPLAEFGLKIVLAEPSLETYGLNWEKLPEYITPETRAVVTVHLYGTPSWDFKVAEQLKNQGIIIVEDNAQAIGATILNPATGKEQLTGSLGDASAFSFYPTKNVGALGDAGAVCTNDGQLATIIKALANYGSSRRYLNEYVGYNCRMDEIQAAVLNAKLNHLPEIATEREKVAGIYHAEIKHPEISLPVKIENGKQVWHQYVVRTPRRNELKEYLECNGIGTDIHYPLALHKQPCFRDFKADRLAIDRKTAAMAEEITQQILSLPIANLTREKAHLITEIINNFS